MRINLRIFVAWVLVGLCANFSLASEALGIDSLTDRIEAHRGEVILLDFWASWCGPCRRSFPWMNKMLAKYQDKGLVIVSVNLDKSREEAALFLMENPAQFEVVYDPVGESARQYEVRTMPTSFLLDRSGQMLLRHRGFLTTKESIYEHSLVKALALQIEKPESGINKKVSHEN